MANPLISVANPRLPLSFDWEDWFQLCCPPFDAPDALEHFEDRLERGTELALQLCDDLKARGTWFCLANQARRHPALLRQIQSAGHVIALHGLDHRRAYSMDRATFRAWTRDGKAALEDLIGTPILGFRAPEWSLRFEGAMFLEELPALGFAYDSSRAPLALLGDPRWGRRPSLVVEGLWELPPPVADLALWAVPLWGWGLRVLPEFWTARRVRELARSDAGTPLTLHPWELDAAQPPLPEASLGHRFAHRAGLRGFGPRLRRLLVGIELLPIEEWLRATVGMRAN